MPKLSIVNGKLPEVPGDECQNLGQSQMQTSVYGDDLTSDINDV